MRMFNADLHLGSVDRELHSTLLDQRHVDILSKERWAAYHRLCDDVAYVRRKDQRH